MLPSQNLIPITLSFPFRGIDTNTPSTMLADGHSPLMTNVELTKDRILQKRTGYSALASVTDAGEEIQRIEEFVDEIGIRHTIAFTNKHQWLYDESTSPAEWRDISYSTALTGTEEDYIDFVVGYDATGKYCVITNGVDKPLWWNGKTVTFEQLPIDLPSFVTCKTLAVFQSRLFLGGLSSTGEQNVITWSAAGDFSDWLGPDTGTVMIAESKGEILALRSLGSQLIVYSRDSIIAMSYTGGDVLYAFTRVSTDFTLISIGGIASFDSYHILLTTNGFFLFDGTPNLVKISDVLNNSPWTLSYETYPHRVSHFYSSKEKCIYWTIPWGSVILNFILRINTDRTFDWFVYSYTSRAKCFSYYSSSSSLTFNCNGIAAGNGGAGYNWDDFGASLEIPAGITRENWNDCFSEKNFSDIVFASGLVVNKFSDNAQDDGVDFSSSWYSPDFVLPELYAGHNGRWLELELETTSNVRVRHSTDRGVTWSEATAFSSDDWTVQKYYLDKVSSSIRFHIYYDGDSQWRLRWLRLWGISEGVL